MKNPFKHHREVEVPKTNDIYDYLRKDSVSVCGVVAMNDDSSFVTQDKDVMVIYEYEFKNANGVSNNIDKENKKKTTALLNALDKKTKMFYLPVKKKPVNKTYEHFMKTYKEVQGTPTERAVMERLNILGFFNNREYSVSCIMLTKSEEKKFLDKAKSFMKVKKFEGREGVLLLRKLNNAR